MSDNHKRILGPLAKSLGLDINTEPLYIELANGIEKMVQEKCQKAGLTPADGITGILAAAGHIAIMYGGMETFNDGARKLIPAMEDILRANPQFRSPTGRG